MLLHTVTEQPHEFSSDMTVEIIPWVLEQGMQICLPPHLTGLFKSAPGGLASHEVIIIGKKD